MFFVFSPLFSLILQSYNIVIDKASSSKLGSNQNLLEQAFLMNIIGIGSFGVTILLFSRIAKTRKSQSKYSIDSSVNYEVSNNNWYKLNILGSLISLIAIVLEDSEFRNPISKSLQAVGLTTLCLLIWNRNKEIKRSRWYKVSIIASLPVFILLIVTSNFSKGALFTPLVIFLLASRLWRESNNGKKVLISILTLYVFTFIFSYIQDIKLGNELTQNINNVAADLPVLIAPFAFIAYRFDGLRSAVEALLAGNGSFGNFESFIQILKTNVLWQPGSGRTDITYGQLWNLKITAQTIPYAQYSKVSLSQSMAADGWIWAGIIGVIAFSIIYALFVLLLGNLLESSSLKQIFGFAILSIPLTFETGLISLLGSISNGIKVLLFLFPFAYLLRDKHGQALRE
jgi:hypothetical protein